MYSPDSLFEQYVANRTDSDRDHREVDGPVRRRYYKTDGPTWAEVEICTRKKDTMSKAMNVVESAKARAVAYMVDSMAAYSTLVGEDRHRADIESAGLMDSPAGPFPADKGIAHWVYEAAKDEGISVPDSRILTITRASTPTWREVYASVI